MANGAGRPINTSAARVCRRDVLAGGLMLAASAGAPALAAATGPPRRGAPRIAFHADQLYLDHTGAAEAYAPPAGLRSLDGLSEDALRRLVYHP